MMDCSFSPMFRILRSVRPLLLVVLAGSVWSLSGCTSAPPSEAFDPADARQAIREVLQSQVQAWNTGDIERFMDGYARTDSLRFASGGQVRRGWTTTLERYRQQYPDRTAMGTLSFGQLDVQVLSPRWALVFGAWRLERAKDTPNGLFTLIVRKTESGAWRIVHDHTSSAGR